MTQQAWLSARVAELADFTRRRGAARAIAEDLGTEDLLIFIQDPELGLFLPAPGFPQTLPHGRQWHAFLQQCATRDHYCSAVPSPAAGSPQPAFGTVIAPGAIAVFLGGVPAMEQLAEVRGVLVLFAKLLEGERAAALAAGHAAAASEAAAHASALARVLDTARAELQDALCAADREITRRREAEDQVAHLLAAEQERSKRLVQVAEASQRINTAHSLEGLLDIITERARLIIGAHHAISSLDVDEQRAQSINAVSVSGKYSVRNDAPALPGASWLGQRARAESKTLRRTQAALAAEFDPLVLPTASELPLVRGSLAAPLTDSNGINVGFIQLSDKKSGDFDADDEAILAQLVHVASGAIENARLYDKLRKADRRKDEFLAMLGHELRNPLAPIRSGLELLAMAQPDKSEIVELLHDQVNHVVRLVDDLLDVSRIAQGRISLRREPVELASIIEQATEAARQLIENRQQTLSISLPEAPIQLNADRIRLVQVIGNVLNNAAKYSDVGGAIKLTAEADRRGVHIRVEDNGIGIDPELLPEIFDLFTQSSRSIDRSQGGLGIGLTLVKQLIELHDGSVEVFSAGRGLGTQFDIHLPTGQASEARATPAALSPSADARRVMVVDDNVGAAAMTSLLIRRLGPHCVETAHDGPSALEKARRFHPDIILLDIGLPKMDGLAVARTLRQSRDFAQTLLVALTGYGQEEDRRKSSEAGFDEHVVKPVDVDTLRRLLHHPLARPQSSPDPGPASA